MQKRCNWSTQHKQLGSSSNFHEKVRKIFCEDPFFGNLLCFQEVSVQTLVPTYPNNTHKVDWYIDELGVVVELHGKQHYTETNFGNIPKAEATTAFHRSKARDNAKKDALEEAGFEYRAISYQLEKDLNGEMLKRIILYGET